MNTTLRVERLYSLADYNNVKFTQEIIEVPERVLLSEKGVGLLYSLMLLEAEKAHKNYIILYKSFPASMEQLDQTAEIIEQERSRTFKEFLETYKE